MVATFPRRGAVEQAAVSKVSSTDEASRGAGAVQPEHAPAERSVMTTPPRGNTPLPDLKYDRSPPGPLTASPGGRVTPRPGPRVTGRFLLVAGLPLGLCRC